MISKKAQAWGFDLIIAGVIFMSALILFYTYSINYPKESNQKLDYLFNDGEFITEILLSQGLPENWDSTNVVRIGLTTNNKINETKLSRFYYLANNATNPVGYKKSKSLFNTNYNFFMNFSQPIIIDSINVQGIGQSFQNHPVSNLVKVTRVTTYQNKVVTLNLYLWE